MKNNFRKKCFLTCTFAAGLAAVIYAADFLSASGVLQQVAERNAKPGEKTGDNVQAQFRAELKAFSSAATNLAPADAAQQWLALVDRAGKLPVPAQQDYESGGERVDSTALLGALPPPATWGELSKAVAARPAATGAGEFREMGLRFLAATLTGDMVAQNREITNLAAKVKGGNSATAYLGRNYLERISAAMLEMSDNPDAILNSLERQLSVSASRGSQDLQVPNLVAQVGAEKAGAFLRKALVAQNVSLNFNAPNETSRLAQKLALELMPQLKSPQWGLINSVDAVELYEAMDKKFPEPTNAAPTLPGLGALVGLVNLPPDAGLDLDSSDNQRRGAQIYYLLGLIGKDRAKEATAVAKKLGGQSSYLFGDAFKAMQRAGYSDALDNFFNELLTQDPTLPFWEQYVETAANAGKTTRMLATVRTAVAQPDLSAEKKSELHQILFRALLAADEVDEAVQELRHLATMKDSPMRNEHFGAGQAGVVLARLGVLLQKPEWTEEGIGLAKKWLATSAVKNNADGNADEVYATLTKVLVELKRGPEAEAILTDALAAATAEGQSQRGYSWRGSRAQGVLTELAALYLQAGRYEDVRHLLEHSADWGASDVSELLGVSQGENLVSLMWLHTGSSPLPLPYLAAKALLATGQKESAQKITDALLDKFPGLDRGYELLLELQGTNAFARLDELFARDQFEERPLIWKAHLLREQNQLEAAEKLLRQAISIDPSDGEEGRGDRMRVYAELAEVRAARGDAKEADFFREVVKAIRLSEDADQFYSLGLLKRAVAMYEEGLKHFSDAYCIQSRLAIQLSALGMTAEAEEHYRRAFELMPDSFGRVESHCFGCEKAFDGERAQSIAEKTFMKIAEERPDKPQVHYLLGYLRQEQERYNEARTNYLTAVRLDPDYLNAWVKIQEVSRQVLMPAKEHDAITFNLLRLDPLSRHTSRSFERVSDLAGLWNAVAAADRQQPVTVTNLFALTASKLALEKKPKSKNEYFYQAARYSASERGSSPAQAVGETPFVNLAGQMIFNSNAPMEE